MKNLDRYKKGIVDGIAVFFVVLFVYTGISKLLDIGIFQSQMAQSEMLRPYTKLLAWAVPIVELGLAGLLLSKSTRQWGLLGSFILMLGFTFYVYLIMTYSPSLPCSCGGILQAMDWPTHLYFNLTATVLAGLTWYLSQTKRLKLWWPLSGAVGMVALISVLFLMRPKPEVLQDDSFVRNYRDIGLNEVATQSLPYNSYYVAGIQDSLIYLGNSTGFTQGMQWNYKTGQNESFTLYFPKNAPESFASLPRWKVKGKYFYVGNGTGPHLYRGEIGKWKAEEFMPIVPFFNDWIVLDSTHFLLRFLQASTQKYVLADFRAEEPYVKYYDGLEQEPGNLFQADGILTQDPADGIVGYLYYYKPKIEIINADLLPHSIKLIYTLIPEELKTRQGRGGLHLREIPIPTLHHNLRMYQGRLYVQSQVMGAGERPEVFKNQTVIDMYDTQGTYDFSFSLPHREGQRMRDFYIRSDVVIALYPTELVVYTLKDLVTAINEQE